MMIERECVVCGKQFMPKVHNQKTCSKKCRDKYMKEYRREYYRSMDKEKFNAMRREYYRKNRDHIRKRQNRWMKEHYSNRKENIERIFEAFQEYLRENYD